MMDSADNEGTVSEDQTSGFNTRQRILTEKGFQYQLGQKEQRFRGIISKWRKHVLKIECLLSERSNLVDIKAERDVLLETMADLSNVYIEVDNLLSTVDQMGSKYSIFEAIEIEHCNLIKRVSEYIHSVTSQGSCSKSSVSAKSHSSTKDEIVTTIAAHEAKLKQIEMKAKFEVQQLELRAKHEAELQRSELAIAKVKLDAIGEQGSVHMDFPDDSLKYTQNYVETLGDVNNPQDRKHLTYEAYLEQPVLRQGVTKSNVPLTGGNNDQPTATRANLGNLTNDFLYQVSLNRLPVPEPEIFSGDPLQYPGWKCAIDLLLENKGIPPSEKIYYLKRYLSGPPKDALEGYFLVPSDSTYIEVRKLLDDRYGNNLAIADAFRSKLEGWPNIQPNDGLALRKFADFLGQCEFALKLVKGRLSFLNDSWENRKLLDKLPDWLVKRWGRVLSEWDDFPPFGKFRQFIAKEADIACNPLIVSSQKGKGSRGTRGASNFVVETGFDNLSTKLNAHRYKCLICEGDHRLDCFYKFLAKTVEDRKIFVKTKNLCYGCLRQGHISKFCRNRLVCNICSRSHPTALHGDIVSHIGKTVCSSSKSIGIQTEPINTGLSHVSGLRDITMNSLILPVYVSHVDAPQREVLVYALLDTQSDSTFITDKTCELLNVEGSKTLLSLSTLSSKNQLVDSSRIGGLSVRGHREGTKVHLPVSYTRCSIPANRSHIPTPGTARQWPHLKRIANHLMPLEQCEIGLLIGYNCPKALMPIEVISPPDNGPYAERTNLGWGIVGIINPRELSVDKCDPVGVSHFIVTPRPTSEFDSILPRDGAKICLKCNVREVVPTRVAGLMELEFNERNFENAYSREDKKFLNILKEGVCQLSDGHYQLPLPMKLSQVFPNNKCMALYRLNQLRKKMERNNTYAKDYVTFMQDIIDKGYAELVPSSELNADQVNYIPHHGVYHPKKPGKIRVVFDCSAKFKGISLNDQLLTGPNLTNDLLGVLCRFRQERIAFAGDIESMFYQFKVNPEQRNLLRFLWWSEGNFNGDPMEYRMTVHLFGAGSSPGCANFGLKQIALDYGSKFGEDVAGFVNRSFYVDDGLKSVDTVNRVVDLISRTKQMLHKGGVNFTKIKCNSKAVLQSIPEEDLAVASGHLDLSSNATHLDRVLGVQWCIESDEFQFKITLSDSPLTRRGILSTIASVYDPFGFIAPVVLPGKQILQQLCYDHLDWDSPLPDELHSKWEKWRMGLSKLETIRIDRCFKLVELGTVTKTELHHFCDASTIGYGYCSYLRMTNREGKVHCSFVLGKSRVVPRRPVTVPRLELTAAVLSVKMSALLKQELEYNIIIFLV
ncbi:uncharacterized protein [Apostichopus japonicus]|uniref:uncharacterized protein n=1 Tax=Stichopus japonicus TaxID=307972 RepID=UPI003AB86685